MSQLTLHEGITTYDHKGVQVGGSAGIIMNEKGMNAAVMSMCWLYDQLDIPTQ